MTEAEQKSGPISLNFVLRAVALVGAGGLLWWTVRSMDVDRVLALLGSLGPAALLLPLPQLLTVVLDTEGWRQLLSRLGGRFPFGALVRIRLIGEAIFLSVAGGTLVSEAVAPLLLSRRGLPVSHGVAAAAVRKCLIAFGDGVYVLVAGLIGFSFARAHSVEIVGVPGLQWLVFAASAAMFAMGGTLMLLLTRGSVAERLQRLMARLSIGRVRNTLVEWRSGFEQTDRQFGHAFDMRQGRLWAAVPWYVASSFGGALQSWLVLVVLGTDVTFSQVLFFEPILSLIPLFLFFLPAGLGVMDAGYVVFLIALGVPDAVNLGAAFIVLRRGCDIFWAVVGYLLLLFEKNPVLDSRDGAKHR